MMLDAIDNNRSYYKANFYTAFDAQVPTYAINPDPFKSDNGLSYTLPVSRKRSRDTSFFSDQILIDRCAPFTFLGKDVSNQIQQQFEIDQFASHHTEKLIAEIEYRRKLNSATIISALEETITKTLIAKEDEITKLTKLNYALEKKMKSICIEIKLRVRN